MRTIFSVRLQRPAVVGAAGDQGRRAERIDVLGRETGDLAEHSTPQVPAKGHGGFGTEVHAGDGGAHLDERDKKHHSARAPDEVRVPAGNTLVDDLRVQAGQVQRSNR